MSEEAKTIRLYIRPPWSSKDLDVLELMQFQKSEEALSKERYDYNMSLSVGERVINGTALRGKLQIKESKEKDENGKRKKTLHFKISGPNNSKFRLGDYIILRPEKTEVDFSTEGIIKYDGNSFYTLSCTIDDKINEMAAQGSVVMDFTHPEVTARMIDKSLDSLASSPKRNIILNIIKGKVDCIIDAESDKEVEGYDLKQVLSKKGIFLLDESQKVAFRTSVVTTPCSMIWGPPGTGKTFMIAIIANYLVSIGKSVLITGFTHRSINNALITIVDHFDGFGIFKIGREEQAEELKGREVNIPNFRDFDSIPPNQRSSGFIVGATPYEVSKSAWKNRTLDYAIFDESSQLTVVLASMAMQRCDKYIFVGDHKQMSPIILGNEEVDAMYSKEMFNKSVFELLHSYYDSSMLTTCYRMNEKLISFSGSTFYDCKIYTPPSVPQAIDLKLPLEKHNEILSPRNIDVVVMMKDSEDNTEAKLAGELVAELVRCGVEKDQIGVIAPFRVQLNAIRKEVHSHLKNSNGILIDTVERFQVYIPLHIDPPIPVMLTPHSGILTPPWGS